jgi:formate dehydrogenase major subunit
MGVTRREFIKLSGSTVLLGSLGVDTGSAEAASTDLRIKGANVTNTICPYCSVGCGIIVHTKDPGHPINEGTLCSKGASLYEVINNPKRFMRPKYRAAGASEWKEVEWDWALDEIAKRVKDTRDRTFMTMSKSKVKEKGADGVEKVVEKDFVVNRTDAIAHVGSAALDNEECYLLQKLMRSWGLVYIEHQARI